jgi:hypothetical protein
MQAVVSAPDTAVDHHADRRPTAVDLVAGLLLLAAVVLHIVAMAPAYFIDGSPHESLFSQPFLAAPAAILAALWATALIVGMLGPSRIAICAAIAAGAALTEMGLRESDLGEIWSGSAKAGTGLWLMTAGWSAGALAALIAVVAARRRRTSTGSGPATPLAGTGSAPDRAEWIVDWPAPAGSEPQSAEEAEGEDGGDAIDSTRGEDLSPGASPETDSTVEVAAVSMTDSTVEVATASAMAPTTALAVTNPDPGEETVEPLAVHSGDTAVFQAIPDEDPSSRAAWTVVVAVLALVVAGAYLPAWDHYNAVNVSSGTSVSYTQGNAFDYPWQIIIGNVAVAVAMVALPVIAVRFRRRSVGAGLALASLAVLSTQFVSAVIQIDVPVDTGSSSIVSTGQLTGWYAVDVLAGFALLVAVAVWATVRVSQENSLATFPKAPEARRDSIPWVS